MTATRNSSGSPARNAGAADAGAGRPAMRGKVAGSRMGGVWVALVVAAGVLLFLLIFILQNGQQARVSFFGAHGDLPVGVALLLAAIFGVLLVALPGTARILQLRAAGRRRVVVAPDVAPPNVPPVVPPSSPVDSAGWPTLRTGTTL